MHWLLKDQSHHRPADLADHIERSVNAGRKVQRGAG
jgi:hypothetical protein